MSELDYIEPSSDSFWEIGQFKRTVKRCEDGYKLCNDLTQMISERADIEKAYAKSLKAWSKKWSDYLQKGSEYGTMKSTWMSPLNEADRMAEIHLTTHNVLNDELNKEIKEWQKQNYAKSIVNQLKTPKEYEEEFKKVQKPWAKKYVAVEKTKKDYHSACKSYQSAKIQFSNSQNDTTISGDQKKKLEDKVEKYKKEVEITKSKYKQTLDDLNSYNARYIEDMNNVYKKCDAFEKERLDFFVQKFVKLHSHLNIFDKMNIGEIYSEMLTTVRQTNPDRDLINWSKDFGSGMPMNWPQFEEYSEELKTIARGSKAKSIKEGESNGGVLMTSIKPRGDDALSSAAPPPSTAADYESNRASVISSSANENMQRPMDTAKAPSYQQQSSKPTSESNPFGDYDDDDDTPPPSGGAHQSPSSNNNHHNSSANNNDSDDDSSNPPNYLNVKVKALYDYQSAEDDELSFKAGEEFIKLMNEDERGWCLGKIGSKIGLYPATYAEPA